jgi:hypothetical protein
MKALQLIRAIAAGFVVLANKSLLCWQFFCLLWGRDLG